MGSKLKPGGAAPDYGLISVNLGDGLRRQLERVCRRRGVSLTEFVRRWTEHGLTREWFWKFQVLRYLVQVLRIALCTDFVGKTLGFSGRPHRELLAGLGQLERLIEKKADERFEETLSPEQREKRRTMTRTGDPVRRKNSDKEPHWAFEIAEVEQILDLL
jgi:hypothetical protein